MKRPKTTLFMLSSLDGKISSGDTDELDVDRDWKAIRGVREGLGQYYELQQETDLVSFNTGRVMAKIGANDSPAAECRLPVSFVIVDSRPHLNEHGVRYLASLAKRLYIVTSSKRHPALGLRKELDNLTVIPTGKNPDFARLFGKLYADHGIRRMTVESGGTMNAALLRAGLIDRVSLVVAPLLVGGSTTPTVMDGEAIHSTRQLGMLVPLKLLSAERLKHSYLHLKYQVVKR